MFQEFIGKDVEMLVAFSTGYSGPQPSKYYGKVLDVSESHVKISAYTKKEKNNQIQIINANYIIYIREQV